MQNDFRQVYLLHRRAHSDSQWMLNMLVEGVGHLSMIARIKGKQSLKHNAHLRPFAPILAQYAGRYDLKYLNSFELAQNPLELQGKQLYCGFYLNELTYRIVPRNEPLEQVFELYQTHLCSLAQNNDVEPILRSYEFQLLSALGFGIEFDIDAHGEPITANLHYQYIPELGFEPIDTPQYGFSGAVLLAMAEHDFAKATVRTPAKHLSRYLLKPLLGNKALKSRELFISR
ncbi:DNA repair protein RecO [Pseudoalteromonas sp. S16_S37]|uniref:DNA repair protein RecO n=1 Tax=Pseudoalteromonas sp. S16_S37 TaxID=2720228 RepID=UPI0016811CDE|nr:DNA repair protein RecO [Pseudoalteromonas sp. S16_S37]MBD1583167.1 DNA repair protein RecO [Pseudoalteromonas sp. S16_S37]